jgi:hypothetical protein
MNLLDIHMTKIVDTMHEVAAVTAAEMIPNRRNKIKFILKLRTIDEKLMTKNINVFFFKYSPALNIVFTPRNK